MTQRLSSLLDHRRHGHAIIHTATGLHEHEHHRLRQERLLGKPRHKQQCDIDRSSRFVRVLSRLQQSAARSYSQLQHRMALVSAMTTAETPHFFHCDRCGKRHVFPSLSLSMARVSTLFASNGGPALILSTEALGRPCWSR